MVRKTVSRRPLISEGIEALEAYLAAHRHDRAKLQILADELTERHTQRAMRLRQEVDQILVADETGPTAPNRPSSRTRAAPKAAAVGAAGDEVEVVSETVERPPKRPVQPPAPSPPPPPRAQAARRARPATPDAPDEILNAWTALEVLSPQSFPRPADLAAMAGSNAYDLIDLAGRSALPWEGAGQKAKPGTRLYYHVVLGTVALEPAVERLLKVYAEARPERFAVRGEAVLATLLLDQKGRPVETNACAISSFAWGLPSALAGDLAGLGDWTQAERRLLGQLDQKIRFEDEAGEIRPVTRGDLEQASRWLIDALGIDGDLVSTDLRAIKAFQYYRLPDAPEPLLLNSFYLDDLGAARLLAQKHELPAPLKAYLGVTAPAVQQDLRLDHAALGAVVRPAMTPTGRWPSGPRSLVLLQQAAVNLSMAVSAEAPILGVNGPPGTGKTTLLRDVVAGQVVRRALAMADYRDPATAFSHAGQMRAGQAWLHLYTLDEKLRGFEMLVASSNNKAVENISAELPALSAVDDQVRHFASIAEHLLERPCWGLIAAVLGNGANRARFRSRFWFDEEAGLRTYLAEAAGTPQWIEILDPDTGKVVSRRKPKVIDAEAPPTGPEAAARRWSLARREFLAVHTQAETALTVLEEIASALEELETLKARAILNRSVLDQARVSADQATRVHQEAEEVHRRDQAAVDAAHGLRTRHHAARPGFAARLFRTAGAKAWSRQEQALSDEAAGTLNQAAGSLQGQQSAGAAALEAHRVLARDQTASEAAQQDLDRASNLIESARRKLGAQLMDDRFTTLSHRDRQLTTPWLGPSVQALRQKVFVAAMNLHRAFIDAAAKPLRHNLGALMSSMTGQGLEGEKRLLLPHLWSSLFLVTPVVSTTFASVSRMLGAMPPESLGWLLIDEAGQALPQAAVGGLMRTRRAVVVGDPIQVEPVVTLPESLTGAICRAFNVDPDLYNAPAASAQILADRATPFASEFETREGSRRVGAPLLVHRRCAEPMFGISNAVAYNNLMVQATPSRTSAIAALLGPSRWLHVESSGEDKWSAREGDMVLELLGAMQTLEAAPDLYIVTPFVTVQDRLRSLVLKSGLLHRWPQIDPGRWVYERIGTIHTVQGREAEAVIFVLGAPEPRQSGARGWAGGTPNLLNVAVSRAQEVLYVIGNRDLWSRAGVFAELHRRMPT